MSEDQIEEIMERLNELELRITKLEAYRTPNRHKKKLSIREFIRNKDPKNDVQKTLIMGYYLEKYENMPFFNINDVKKCFKDAREKIPQNVADKIQINIKKGHLMDYEEKKDNLKAYNLTNSGEDYIDNNFEGRE